MSRYSNSYGVWLYSVVNFCMAALAWFTFFSFRKRIELGSDNFDISLVTNDQNLIVGLALVPLGWMMLYYLLEGHHDIFRLSRINTIFRTAGITLLGTLILLFTILIDDIFLRYETYLRSFLALFTIHFVLTCIGRIAVISFFKRLISKGKVFYNTIILGDQKDVEQWQQISICR